MNVSATNGPTTVGDLMSPEPIVVSADIKLSEAARIMEEGEVSGVPVIDGDGELVGMLSETDLVRVRATAHLWQRWPGLAVRHIMHTPVLTADRLTTATEAAVLMEEAHVHRLVVVDAEKGDPIGVISTSDLVRAMVKGQAGG